MQPVHDLVIRACQEYDKGADCLSHALVIWSLPEGQNVDTMSQLFDCGFGAQGPGGTLLADANATGLKILLPN